MRAIVTVLIGLGIAASSLAQSRSSFLDVDSIAGIDVAVSNGGLTYTVTFNPGAKFTYLGSDYFITDVFGFWTLSDDDDLVATNQNIDVWDAHQNNAGTGGIAGWKTNPNTGLTSGESKVFTFDALSVDKVDRTGFHVRIDGTFPGTDGNTGYITNGVVPEPMSIIALGSGLALLVARRRRK